MSPFIFQPVNDSLIKSGKVRSFMTGRGRESLLKEYFLTSYEDGKIATIYAKGAFCLKKLPPIFLKFYMYPKFSFI
jgi:hypothetical protein